MYEVSKYHASTAFVSAFCTLFAAQMIGMAAAGIFTLVFPVLVFVLLELGAREHQKEVSE